MTPRLPNHKTCCGCSACRSICPKSAIAMTPDNEGFLQPVIDQAKCVHCGKCEKVCPVLHHGKPREPLAVYAAKAKDDNLRAGSASGGTFTLLALDVLKRGGVVFGAGFDHSDWRVIHKVAHNEKELDDLRGSKYVQSDVGNTYKDAKRLLDDGKEVLYSGCPCQIAALLNFLGKKYPNLTTVDLICHGVPSPLAWRKYLDDREREADAKIMRTLARRYCKWQEFALSFEFSNDSAYSQAADSDSYMLAFGRWWMLRESCYHCKFKNFKSNADISIGDYSGRFQTNPAVCDDLGTSVVFPCTALAAEKLNGLSSRLDLVSTTIRDTSKFNPCIRRSTQRNRQRNFFYNRLAAQEFDATVRFTLTRRHCSLIWHCLWWTKRFFINGEVNEFQLR